MIKKISFFLVISCVIAGVCYDHHMSFRTHDSTVKQSRISYAKNQYSSKGKSLDSQNGAVAKSSNALDNLAKDGKPSSNSISTFPDLSQYSNLSVHVNIEDQNMQILSGEKVLYSTVVSTGKNDSPTPRGHFVIEQERGDFFFNKDSGEGACYWVSFKEHGIYLFHSVPTDEFGNEIKEEADALGTPVSHGCVRMSRTVAQWFCENIPSGIPVNID